MSKPVVSAALVAALALSASAVAQAKGKVSADLILTNARVYTVEDKQPWAEAVAIKDGKIVAVGSSASVGKLRGASTRTVDLGGRLVLPAFGDAHVHPLFGALSRSRCPLQDGKTIEDYQALIAKCVAAVPGDGAVYGIGWSDALFPPNGIPRKELLDKVSTTRPLIFESTGGHTYWLNSKALEVAKITRDTKDPPNGTIDRDPATGEPVGSLQEAAMDLVKPMIPPPSATEIQNSILYVADHFNSLGIVSWNDAGVEYDDNGGSPMVDAYKAVLDAGKLTSHVAVSLKWKNERGMDQLPGLLRAAERANSLGISTHTVKFYVDGVIPQKTAYMLAPYENSGDERGTPQIAPEVLKQAVTEVDGHGMHAFLHAIGDGGVRISLDAIEAARKANGSSGLRHELAHAGFISPADIPRFAKLDAIPDYCPIIWYPSPIIQAVIDAVGPRGNKYWPTRSLIDAGAEIAPGSDWPAAVPDMNPWTGVEALVTRKDPSGATPGLLWPEEAATLEEAIRIYTVNGARALRLGEKTGSIEVGKSADIVVLDRNLFKVAITDVGDAKVRQTWFEGKLVHEGK